MLLRLFLLSFLSVTFYACNDDDSKKTTDPLIVTSFSIDGTDRLNESRITGVSFTPTLDLTFSVPVDPEKVNSSFIQIVPQTGSIPVSYTLSDNNTTITLTPTIPLADLRRFYVWISPELTGTDGQEFP